MHTSPCITYTHLSISMWRIGAEPLCKPKFADVQLHCINDRSASNLCSCAFIL